MGIKHNNKEGQENRTINFPFTEKGLRVKGNKVKKNHKDFLFRNPHRIVSQERVRVSNVTEKT